MLAELKTITETIIAAVRSVMTYAQGTRRAETLRTLLTAHYCLRLIAQTGRELVALAGPNPREKIAALLPGDRTEYWVTCQRHLSLQLARLLFLHDVLYGQPVVDLFDPALRADIDRAVGDKEEGLYGIGAALQFHFMLGPFPEKEHESQFGREVASLFAQASLTSFALGSSERYMIDLPLAGHQLTELEKATERLRLAILELCSPTEALALATDAETQARRIGCQGES